MEDVEKYGFTIGCPGCRAKNRGEIGVNHNVECRQRIEEKMRMDDPERYMRTLGRLAEGTLKEGTLKGDERQEGGEQRKHKGESRGYCVWSEVCWLETTTWQSRRLKHSFA